MTRKLYKAVAVGMLLLAVSLLAAPSAESVDSPSFVFSTDFEDWSVGEDGAARGFFTVQFPSGGLLQSPRLGIVTEKHAGNKSYRLSEKQKNLAFLSDKDLADFVLSFSVEVEKGGYAVFFRVDPGHDGYLLDGGVLGTVRKLTTGTPRWFAQEPSRGLLRPGTYDVRLIAIGDDILVFRDGALVISASNDLFSHGLIGLAEPAQGVIYIDNLSLREIKGIKAVLSETSHDSVFHVAILSTDSFDAISELYLGTLTFGRTGEEDSLQRAAQDSSQICQLQDYDGDGRTDVVCPFDRVKTGLNGETSVGILFGFTQAGDLVGGIVDL